MSAALLGGITGGSSSNASQSTSGANRFGEMSTDEFVKVLMSELSNQDPLAPQDSGALLEQLSGLRNIESQLSLQKTLESLVLQNSIAGSANLIGKQVRGLDANNDEISGLVTSVRVEEGKAILELDNGKSLAADRLTEINLAPGQ